MIGTSIREAAALPSGDAPGHLALISPGPGHRPQDRSLNLLFDLAATDKFVVHSFVGNYPIACRDHVRTAFGIRRPWQPGKRVDDMIAHVSRYLPRAAAKPSKTGDKFTPAVFAAINKARERGPRA